MYRKLLLIISLFAIVKLTFTLSVINEEDDEELHAKEMSDKGISSAAKMRCTRRFTPGSCVEDVVPVWTFVFLAQNCTERLGCPSHYIRTNRFRSYRACMRRCRGLAEMYLQMVMVDDRQKKTEQHEGLEDGAHDRKLRLRVEQNQTEKTAQEIFRSGKLKLDRLPKITLPAYDDEEEYKEEPEKHAIYAYKDYNINEDVAVPDIDYIGGEFRSEFDVIHW